MKEIYFLNTALGKLPDSGSLFMDGNNSVEVRSVRGYPKKGEVVDFTERSVTHQDGSSQVTHFLVQGTRGVKVQDGEVTETQGFKTERLKGKRLELARQLAALELAVILSLCEHIAVPRETDVVKLGELHRPIDSGAGIQLVGIYPK